ncbi:MAG: P-loop NTPase fold protein [Actinomycetota bacterium]|nr:P-loop NTPase fold protein [Actinomycetota bacterium]
MVHRFTDRARRVVVLAQEEAGTLNHGHIGTKHILLGLIHEGEGIAAKTMESLGISLEAVRNQVEGIIREDGGPASGYTIFTPRAEKVLELSLREALQLGHDHIGTEHLLLGLISEGDGVAAQILVKLGTDLTRVREQVTKLLSGSAGKEGAPAGASLGDSIPTAFLVLNRFGRNLTKLALENQLDPILDRDREIERVMQILTRRTKNTLILISDSGVVTKAIVEGLARQLVADTAPDMLRGKQLYALDHESLPREAADTGRFHDALHEASNSGQVILFVDQVQEFLNATLEAGAAHGASLLEEIALQGDMPIIGSMTSDDFGTYLEVLEGGYRFEAIPIAEPTARDTIEILRSTRDRSEARHRITITDQAVDAAAVLADRYIRYRVRPDTAVDLLEEACVRRVRSRSARPPGVRELDKQLVHVRRRKETAIENQKFEQARQLRDKEAELLGQRAPLEEQWKAEGIDLLDEVDEDDVIAVVCAKAGVSAQRLRASLDDSTFTGTTGPLPTDAEAPIYRMLNDAPADDAADDLLGTARVAARIASSLSAVSSPFVLALDGGWGVGKSTLLHHIETCLPTSMVKVRFNAWTAQNGDEFEGLIKSVLTELDPNVIRRWTRKVLKRHGLTRTGRIGFALVGRFFGITRLVDELWSRLAVDAQSRNELRTVIHEMLSDWVRNEKDHAHRTLVVLVDDLDRCSDDVVVGLCEAVKLYLDAPGLIFVLACDLSVLAHGVSARARGGSGEGRRYLEKIVQVVHRVPVPDAASLSRLLEGYADRSGTAGLIDDTIAGILTGPTGRNPRRIKRIINSFVLEYELDPVWRKPPLGSAELITTVVLQHLYPSFYEFLASEEAGDDPIANFLDYAEVLARASDPPPAGDAWWSMARRTFRRYGLAPPSRSRADRGRLASEVEGIDPSLPADLPQLARDSALLSLLRGVIDSESRRAMHAHLISRPLVTEPLLEESFDGAGDQ